MKKSVFLFFVIIALALSGCKTMKLQQKHYNARNLTDRK